MPKLYIFSLILILLLLACATTPPKQEVVLSDKVSNLAIKSVIEIYIYKSLKIDINDPHIIKPAIICNRDELLVLRNKLKLQKNHRISWFVSGYRGFHAYDAATGAKIDYAYPDLNAEIRSAFLLDEKNGLICVTGFSHDLGGGDLFYFICDLPSQKVIHTQVCPAVCSFPFYGRLLFMGYDRQHKPEWYITDIYGKNKEENKLTDMLNQYQIEAEPPQSPFFIDLEDSDNITDEQARRIIRVGQLQYETGSINTAKNMLLGKINGKNLFIFMRWDVGLKIVSIEPVTAQRAGKDQYIDEFDFAPEGDWAKWESAHFGIQSIYISPEQTKKENTDLVFHLVDAGYAGGLSAPVPGGNYEGLTIGGFFYAHEDWGPCYVVLNFLDTSTILVYKLSDLEKIAALGAKK